MEMKHEKRTRVVMLFQFFLIVEINILVVAVLRDKRSVILPSLRIASAGSQEEETCSAVDTI